VGILVGASELGLATLSSTPTTPASTGTSTGSGSTTGTGTGTTSGTGTSGTGSTSSGTTSASTADGTWTGQTVQTRFGPVQVQVTISGGAITEVTALQLTNHDGKSVAISNRAAPILRQEVLSAQSAQVSNVSGATYTTQAYLSSLQSALDQAGF
jgi:uncharacterized protein with FMN-binding domain